MKSLEKNILNQLGETGKKWLDSLPVTIAQLSKHWSLSDVKPVHNMNWNFVATAFQNKNTPVILKISSDKKLLQNEYEALKHFNGHGAIKVLEIDESWNALLLEAAIPGNSLKSQSVNNKMNTIENYARVVKQIASQSMPHETFPHVSQWLSAIDDIRDPRLKKPWIDTALQQRCELLNTMEHEYLCHGDLHLDNILQQGSDWLAIDPKGIIGEIAFEAAAFDLISEEELQKTDNISILILERIQRLSYALAIDFNRLFSWIFLRILLSAQWFIEDNGDPSLMLTLAHHMMTLQKNKRRALK